jgi:hypothetical protein
MLPRWWKQRRLDQAARSVMRARFPLSSERLAGAALAAAAGQAVYRGPTMVLRGSWFGRKVNLSGGWRGRIFVATMVSGDLPQSGDLACRNRFLNRFLNRGGPFVSDAHGTK